MERYQIWEGEGITLIAKQTYTAYTARQRNLLIGQPRRLVREFSARSWDEACQIQYDHYGWGKYKPLSN